MSPFSKTDGTNSRTAELGAGVIDAEPSVMPFEKCCAKTGIDGGSGMSVFDHCRYAGAVANGLYGILTDAVRQKLFGNVGLLVAIHDIGKVSPGFQGKYFIENLESYSPIWAKRARTGSLVTDHAAIGAAAYMKLAEVEQTDPEVVAIACHHGAASHIGWNTDGPLWQRERKRLVEALAMAFGVCLDYAAVKAVNARLLSGLTCVADWIASNEEYFSPGKEFASAERLSEYVSRILAEIGFSRVRFAPGLSFGDLFHDEHGHSFAPRSEQNALIAVVQRPGVYVMEATMGSGKTEAALVAAYNLIVSGQNAGMYFALPTRLTSDRIYLRAQHFLDLATGGGTAVRLSHGRAWLENYQISGSVGDGRWLPSWFSPSKRGLLYPFAVGTIDQALLAAMNVRHSFVRLFGLAGKVVILDEVHSYDLYTGSLVEALVRDLRQVGCTVIILSATLTRAKRDALLGCSTPVDAAYPLVSGNVDGEMILKAPHVDVPGKVICLRRLEGADSVVEDALDHARVGCDVLCVANTVHQAQHWYRLLKAAMLESDERLRVGLLHSRFPDFRRNAIEDEWMMALGKGDGKRPHGSILISTQIVEQSVDIDADYLITELAPVDMLFQRMGRLWRHERANRPVVAPMCAIAFDGTCDDGLYASGEGFRLAVGAGSCCVYAPYVLLRTMRVLEKREKVSIPGDMRTLLEAVYAEQSEEENSTAALFKEELDATRKDMQGAAAAAEASVTSLPARDDSEDVPPTRYGSRKSMSLLLVSKCDDGIGCGKLRIELLDGRTVCVDKFKSDFAVTKALYANVVSVPVNKTLGEQAREYERKTLCCHFHGGDMPLLCRVETDGALTIVATGADAGMVYRNDIGIYDASRMGGNDAAVKSVSEEQTPYDLGGADW